MIRVAFVVDVLHRIRGSVSAASATNDRPLSLVSSKREGKNCRNGIMLTYIEHVVADAAHSLFAYLPQARAQDVGIDT